MDSKSTVEIRPWAAHRHASGTKGHQGLCGWGPAQSCSGSATWSLEWPDPQVEVGHSSWAACDGHLVGALRSALANAWDIHIWD